MAEMGRLTEQGIGTRLAVNLAVLGMALELCISANLLTWLGVPYVSEGGSLPIKLHPGTDLLLLAFAALFVGRGAWSRVTGDTLLLCFTTGMTACLAYLLVTTGTGNLIVLLDTFLPAGLLATVLMQATPSQLARLRRLMQVLLAASAVLALAELSMQATLVPLYLNDAAYNAHDADFRPTALFDHPLTGAVMAMLGLSLCPAQGGARLVYGGVMWAALIAFGGRMALATSLVLVATTRLLRLGRLVLLRDAAAGRMLVALAAAICVAVPVAGLAFGSGLGTRIAGHLYWDDSAQVRLAQWQLLDQLDKWQLLFGTSRDDLLALLTPLRLDSGVEVIENFWLLMFVALGVLGFPLFAISLGTLLAWCWRRTMLQGRLLLLGVMLVASTSNSLGRKSTILVCLVSTISCLPRRSPAVVKLACRVHGRHAVPEAVPA